MTAAEFQDLLGRTGGYETDPTFAGSFGDRLFGRSDTWFYLRVCAIVWRALRLSRRQRYDRVAWAESSLAFLRVVEGCGGRIHLAGTSRQAQGVGGRVYVSNHMSMLETFLLPVILLTFSDMHTVIKEKLLRYAVFGPVLGATDPIVVTRANAREDLKEVLGRGTELLSRGHSVLIFPQATRSVEFDPSAFNTLGVKLARKAGVPIVPIALKTDFQGVGSPILKDFGPLDRRQSIHLQIGEPLAVTGNGRAAHEETVRFITRHLLTWSIPIRGNDGAPAEG